MSKQSKPAVTLHRFEEGDMTFTIYKKNKRYYMTKIYPGRNIATARITGRDVSYIQASNNPVQECLNIMQGCHRVRYGSPVS